MDNLKKINIDEANVILKKWQKILRLQDFDIHIEIMERDWRKSGDMKVSLDCKQAVVLLNEYPKCENLSELIIHELIHVKLWGMDQMIEDLIKLVYGEGDSLKKEFPMNCFMSLLEETVQDLTKGYIETADLGPLSIGSFKGMIAKEAESNTPKK